MKEEETLYARWLNNEITKEELDALTKDGAIDDLQRIVKTTDQWNVSKFNKQEGLKDFKSKYKVKEKSEEKSNEKSEQPSGRRIYLKWAAGIAASLLLFVTVFNYYTSNANQVLLANNGKNKSINLPEGSSITVNDGSSISYSKERFNDNRAIELTGEAAFKVEKGAPFIVNTKNGSIEVLGTEFNVRAWGDNLYVECYEGSVKVSDGKNETILSQNESVNVIAGSMKEKQMIDHESPLWTGGISRFYEENINEVFLEMARQYDVIIKTQQMDQTFSGIFDHSDLEEALSSICLPLGLQYKLSKDKKQIVIE